jgi:hypothetical protein
MWFFARSSWGLGSEGFERPFSPKEPNAAITKITGTVTGLRKEKAVHGIDNSRAFLFRMAPCGAWVVAGGVGLNEHDDSSHSVDTKELGLLDATE